MPFQQLEQFETHLDILVKYAHLLELEIDNLICQQRIKNTKRFLELQEIDYTEKPKEKFQR